MSAVRVKQESEDQPHRPRKKARMDNPPPAAIETKVADVAVSLEVDIMILDYLAYQTTLACFVSRHGQQSAVSLGQNVVMSDAFLTMFKLRHPRYSFDAELRFRLLLLKLVTLFTQRLTRNPSSPDRSALEQLREANKRRAMEWIGTEDRIPTATLNTSTYEDAAAFPQQEELDRNRAHVLHSLSIPPENDLYEDAHYGTSGCVGLLDLLPLFIQVSAASMSMTQGHLTETWMELACEMMLQACLEQYLVVGANGTDAVDEAFAWGFKGSADDTEGDEVNDMFIDGVYEDEVEGWSAMKKGYLEQLFPETGADLTAHLEKLAARHSIVELEAQMLDFLGALAQSIEKPVLVQLEEDRLEGMSKQETLDFLRSCGIDLPKI